MRLCDELKTGDEVEVDMENDVLTVVSDGRQFNLKPLGEVIIGYNHVRLESGHAAATAHCR